MSDDCDCDIFANGLQRGTVAVNSLHLDLQRSCWPTRDTNLDAISTKSTRIIRRETIAFNAHFTLSKTIKQEVQRMTQHLRAVPAFLSIKVTAERDLPTFDKWSSYGPCSLQCHHKSAIWSLVIHSIDTTPSLQRHIQRGYEVQQVSHCIFTVSPVII